MAMRQVAAFLLIALASVSARAATITWAFDGVVRDVRGDPAFVARASSLGVAPGASFTGQLHYEYPTSDENPLPGANYPGGSYELEVGGFLSTTLNGMRLIVDTEGGGSSFPEILAWDLFVSGDASRTDLFTTGYYFTLGLVTGLPGVIPDESQPLQPPALADLLPYRLADWEELGTGTGIQLYGRTPSQEVYIELTRLEVAPEPRGLIAVALLLLLPARFRSGRAA